MSQKPRPRRIAADEAHAWARNLRLGNPLAKLVLCMLTLYVNGDGECFASVNQLADDTELDRKTVMARLAWLETARVIRRKAQWLDEFGIRNSESRGRRTSDLIVLLIDQREGNSPDGDIKSSGTPDGPQRSTARTTKVGLGSASGPPVVHLGGPPESSNLNLNPSLTHSRANDGTCTISAEAHAFADELARIAGHDPAFLPPQWVSYGPAYRVQMMLDRGWRIEIMRPAATAVMQRKRDGPPATIRYFEKIFARAHAAPAPLPEVDDDAKTPGRHGTNWQTRRDAKHGALDELRAFNEGVRQRGGGTRG